MKDEVMPSGRTAPIDLRVRTKDFALRVVRLYAALPSASAAQILGKQLLRSGTSVGAHYREGHRARSTAEFVSKIEGALQELDESIYWMELLVDGDIINRQRLVSLMQETNELTAILVACVKKAKSHQTTRKSPR